MRAKAHKSFPQEQAEKAARRAALRLVSYILKLNDLLFVCPELIEELAGVTELKFGMHVEHVLSRNMRKDLSDISTNSEIGDKMSWPIRFESLIWFHYSGLLVILLPTD